MYNVYRMEDFGGRGPFSNGHIESVYKKTGYPFLDIQTYPNPYCENLVKINEDLFGSQWFCGTINLNYLFHWFPKDKLKQFEEVGLYISVYNVSDPEDIRIGRTQVLFRRDRSKILRKIKPSEWVLYLNFS